MLTASPAVAAPADLAAYMRARAAGADGAAALAARDYADALAGAPGNAAVALRAYREALVAGDLALVDRAAETLAENAALPSDAPLLAIAKAAHARDYPAAQAGIAELEKGTLALLAAPLRAWLAFDTGGDALAPLAARPKDVVARRFAEETRALILLAQGKTAEGLAVLRVALGTDQGGQDLRIAAAELLIGTGRAKEARALLIGESAPVAALRADAGKGETPSLAFGASRLFTRIASDLASGPAIPLSITLTRAALRADPTTDRAHILLAAALAQNGATEQALREIAAVDTKGPYGAAARAGRIQILMGADRGGEALDAAQDLAKPKDAASADIRRYADLLMEADRAGDAVPVYRRLIDRGGADADWAGWLQYGSALDGAGDWKDARKALERAVALGPEEPLALNYLGYSMIENGEDAGAARALLEKAAKLKPDDAAIIDSLGWAYYRDGQVARALPLLERAAAASPDNAEIGEHLGDAYWSAGRRFEARYAWRAAQLAADDADGARLSGKIANGLQTR